jgi:hypothetical protein
MASTERAVAGRPEAAAYDPLRAAVAELKERLLDLRGRWEAEARELEALAKESEDKRQQLFAAARRKYAITSLFELMKFLGDSEVARVGPDVKNSVLDLHLHDLASALTDLDKGWSPDLLEPIPQSKGRASPTNARFKAFVATAADLLFRSGDSLDAACETVARRVTEAGYRTPRGRKLSHGDKITGSTVRDWRKEARSAPADSPLGEQYCDDLDHFSGRALAPEQLRTGADKILNLLAEYRLAFGFAEPDSGRTKPKGK